MGARGLKNVVAMGLVSLLTDASSGMVFGILPIFLIHELGVGKAILGLVEGLAEALGYVLRIPSGYLSDRLARRKPIVLLGYAISSAMKPMFALATGWQDVLLVRAGERVGKGVRSAPRDVMITESVKRQVLGRSFGIHRTLDQIGEIVGPLAAIPILAYYGMRGVFLFSLVPGALAVLILALFVRETAGVRRDEGKVPIREVVREPRFLWLMAAITALSFGSYNFAFILVRAGELGVAREIIPIIYAIINIAHTSIGYPAGTLSDRAGRERALLLGYSPLVATSVLSMSLGLGSHVAFLIAALYGMHRGVIETAGRALIPLYSTKDALGTAYGFYYMIMGASSMAGNLAFGAVWDIAGPDPAFTLSIASIALGSIVMFRASGSRS